MANSNNSTLGTVSEPPGHGFIVARFAIFTIAVNVIFFIIGLNKLEKKAHNMLVVCVCGSNCLYGFSLFIIMFTGKEVLYVLILCIIFRILKRDVSVSPNDNMLFISNNQHRRQNRQKQREKEAPNATNIRLGGLLDVKEVGTKEHTEISTKNAYSQALDNKQPKDLQLGYSIKNANETELLSNNSKMNLKFKLHNEGSTLMMNECTFDEQPSAGIIRSDDIVVCVGLNSERSSQSEEKAKIDNLKTATRQWELRAIATSGYVIGTTLVLRGPLVLLMAIDAFGIEVPNGIGDLAAILVSVQCLIDPFVYAFRFHTIRRALKKIICCKKAEN
ncbi:Hypothetical predicted protein [Mytilus galloprovincialis]|uniref:G-protein coupled receptors family 1 profile domain-containing protein n=1 Tax=Mytilus galloprovincialis TaxID=29158 RepID=A0A8B6FAA5_MYTGA|nr:Hypothetical predicted protein [Mytilus galloprovincialis]